MENADIDFVIIWVDGSDEKWIAERKKYSPEENADDRNIRYRDWNNLQYWFRGVEKFAPWVRKVFFVTWGHVPEWLNLNHDKLQIVKHEEFIPQEYLPTFSSHTIELNLHRINGLSRKFVYFNDDMFLLNKVKPEDYFKNNLPVKLAALDAYSYKSVWHSYVGASCISIINDHFNKYDVIKQNYRNWFRLRYGKFLYKTIALLPWKYFTGIKHSHLEEPFLKDTFYNLWNQEFDVLDNTCLHKFRVPTDVNQWLMTYWEIASARFYPSKGIKGELVMIETVKDAQKCAEQIKQKKYKSISINDYVGENNEEFQEIIEIINKAFLKLFPNKSKFEC